MAEHAAPEATESKPASSKKLILIIAAAAILLLLVLGGGLFLFRHSLFGSSESTASSDGETKATAKKSASSEKGDSSAAKKNGKKTNKGAKVAALVVLEPFTVNLQDPEGNRYMRLVIHLGMETEESAKAAENPILKAKIRNAILRYICTLTAEEVLSKDGKEKLINNIIDRTNEALDEESIVEVFIIDLIVQ